MVVEYEDFSEERSFTAAVQPQDTSRLAITQVRTDDLADIIFLANNLKIAEMLSSLPHPFSLDDAKAVVKRSEANTAANSVFAIRMKNTGRFIGAISYHPVLEQGNTAHVGYWLGEPFWGQGFATEAMHAVVDHAFEHGGYQELTASFRVTNPASKRVLEKSGFQFRDHSMMRSMGAKGTFAVERFSLTRATWQAIKRWGKTA